VLINWPSAELAVVQDGLNIEVNLSLPSEYVIRALEDLIQRREEPSVISFNNGLDRISEATFRLVKSQGYRQVHPAWQIAEKLQCPTIRSDGSLRVAQPITLDLTRRRS
jgi:hypothetical protein